MKEYLLSVGFTEAKFVEPKESRKFHFDLMLRIHDITYLVWYEDLDHFGLAVKNESNKKGPAGTYQGFKVVLIPRVVKTTDAARELILSLSPPSKLSLIKLITVRAKVNGEEITAFRRLDTGKSTNPEKMCISCYAREVASRITGLTKDEIVEGMDYFWDYETYNPEQHNKLKPIELL